MNQLHPFWLLKSHSQDPNQLQTDLRWSKQLQKLYENQIMKEPRISVARARPFFDYFRQTDVKHWQYNKLMAGFQSLLDATVNAAPSLQRLASTQRTAMLSDHAELAATEQAQREAARAGRGGRLICRSLTAHIDRASGELTRFFPRIDRIFPSSTSTWYFRG